MIQVRNLVGEFTKSRIGDDSLLELLGKLPHHLDPFLLAQISLKSSELLDVILTSSYSFSFDVDGNTPAPH